MPPRIRADAELEGLISQVLTADQIQRVGVKEALVHPWLDGRTMTCIGATLSAAWSSLLPTLAPDRSV